MKKDPDDKRDTLPADPPTEPNAAAAPFEWPEHSPVPRIICEICNALHGDHDPACPLFAGVVTP